MMKYIRIVLLVTIMMGAHLAHANLATPNSYSPVVKKAAPAVVNIYTKTRVQVQENISPFANDPFFKQFFGEGFAIPSGRTREQIASSLGSGVLIDAKGTIVTSNHVVKDAQEIRVVLADKREFAASVTLRDPQSDLAFLKIEGSNFPFLELRDSDTLEVGDVVLAIGNPFGVGQTVTSGIISALARAATGVSDYQFFIQTDAAINPGNSGGALVDTDGNLIGINTAIYSKNGGSLGIGFAIPANMIRALQNGKVAHGKVVRPWLGITVQPVTSEIAESMGMASPEGVIVSRVLADSPVEKAGIKVGDAITAINGVAISNSAEFGYRIALSKIGETLEFSLIRDGKKMNVNVEMEAPSENPPRDLRTLKGNHPLSGITVGNPSEVLASELGVNEVPESGVFVVSGKSPIAQFTLSAGDVIVQVNGTKITSTQQLEQLMKPSRNWEIIYIHGGNTLTLTIRL